MISKYTDLYPLMQPDLPGIPEPLLLQHLQQAGREFCQSSEAWRERLDYNIVDAVDADDTAYDAAIALGQSAAAAEIAGNAAYNAALQYTLKPSYDVDIVRPWKVWDTGDDDDNPLDPGMYDFDAGSCILTLNYTPPAYSPVAETWATGHAYTAGEYVISSSLRYLCAIAHTAAALFATDLAAYRWKLMPNDLLIDAVLIPRLYTVELAGWFMEKWAEAIVAKAKVDLMAMKDKSWSSPERVPYFNGEYVKFLNRALRENLAENKNQGLSMETRPWARG